MAKTVVGLFDNQTEAQEVLQDLVSQGYERKKISLLANNAKSGLGQGQTQAGDHEGEGNHAGAGLASGAVAGGLLGGGLGLVLGIIGATAIPVVGPIIAAGPIAAALAGAGVGAAAGGILGALTGAGVPDEDANYYAEGVKRGGTLVMVEANDQEADDIYNIMQDHGAVDIDERGANYRQEGFSSFDPNAAVNTRSYSTEVPTTVTTTTAQVAQTQAQAPVTVRQMDTGEAVLPVMQEELQVGKRQVQRGGVRIYNRMVETPVEEQVKLHEETVNVERHPVNRAVTEADMASLKEGSFEVTARSEEAVVSKQARVVEEIVVDKQMQDRVETVRDTVRRTDVEVEKLTGTEVDTTTQVEKVVETKPKNKKH